MFDVALEKRCECSELPVGVQGFESFRLFKPIGVRSFGGWKYTTAYEMRYKSSALTGIKAL